MPLPLIQMSDVIYWFKHLEAAAAEYGYTPRKRSGDTPREETEASP